MNSIKLSLCIPTYNRPEEFKRMLSGVLPQLNNQVEVVVRDDSQTPETKNIFDKSKSRVLTLKRNKIMGNKS